MYLAITALVLLVGGFFAYRYFSMYESTDDAEVDGHLMPLSARISGYVIKVNVDDNQYVDAGTVLAEIDPRDYQVALDQANAQLADAQATAQALNINVPIASVNSDSQVSSSEADVENARAGISVAQDQFSAAKAQLDQAQANDVKAQNDLIRYKQLVDKQEISQQLYDQAVAAAKANSAAVASAHASATAAEQQVTQARSRLAQAEANYRNAQTGPRQVASTRARALSADATVLQKASRGGAGAVKSSIHENHRAGERRGQQKRRSRNERATRPATVLHRPARRSLGHRQLQGNAAEIHAPRPSR